MKYLIWFILRWQEINKIFWNPQISHSHDKITRIFLIYAKNDVCLCNRCLLWCCTSVAIKRKSLADQQAMAIQRLNFQQEFYSQELICIHICMENAILGFGNADTETVQARKVHHISIKNLQQLVRKPYFSWLVLQYYQVETRL